ncbi:MAG: outer membrane protein assembly factor BamE [Rubrivivax sp.]
MIGICRRFSRCKDKTTVAVLAVAGLSGCASVQQVTDRADVLGREVVARLQPYRVDIVQGNVITSEQAQAVRLGMTRQQVRAVLGSPMLADPFHADRWDYIFTIRREGTPPQRRHVVAWFSGGVLERLDIPEDLPSESAFVAAIDPVPPSREALPVLELTPEQREALAARSAAANMPAAPPTPAAVPRREFPPLEPR